MPQMAPINWLLLFMIFCSTFLLFNMINYYSYSPILKKSDKTSFKNYSVNWKW